MSLYRSPSSAISLVSDEVHSGKSFMNARKYNGPFTVPWGTPEKMSAWSDIFHPVGLFVSLS